LLPYELERSALVLGQSSKRIENEACRLLGLEDGIWPRRGGLRLRAERLEAQSAGPASIDEEVSRDGEHPADHIGLGDEPVPTCVGAQQGVLDEIVGNSVIPSATTKERPQPWRHGAAEGVEGGAISGQKAGHGSPRPLVGDGVGDRGTVSCGARA
jgi:hypothetical protein